MKRKKKNKKKKTGALGVVPGYTNSLQFFVIHFIHNSYSQRSTDDTDVS